MPYISTTTTVPITRTKETVLKEKLGQAIALIPGKTESWLMLSFQPDTTMYFKGSNEKPMAFVNVSIFGGADDSAYDALTARITEIFGEELGIAPEQVYIKYEEASHWGWNGVNF